MVEIAPPTATIPARLELLLAEFSKDAKPARTAVRDFAAHFPESFARQSLDYLVSNQDHPACEFLVQQLCAHNLHIGLLELDAMAGEAAIGLLNQFAEIDPMFCGKLQTSVLSGNPKRFGDIKKAEHFLDLVAFRFRDPSRFVETLSRLVRHGHPRVRVKAEALLQQITKIHVHQLSSGDPRIRANAVEGLWYLEGADIKQTLQMAATDPHHRVAVNALIGLYFTGEASALEQLRGLTSHSSYLFRAAAFWGLGRIGEAPLLSAITQGMKDPEPAVRGAAFRAMMRLRKSAS